MSIVDLSRISEHYHHKVKCKHVNKLEDLNWMIKHKWVVSIYHYDIIRTVVYYIEEEEDDDDDSTHDPAPLT